MYNKYKILVVGFLSLTFLLKCNSNDNIGSIKNYKISLPSVDIDKEDSLNFNLDKKVLPYIKEWTAYNILFDKLFIENRLKENMMDLKRMKLKRCLKI